MTTIINNTGYTLSTSSQQAIHNTTKNCGLCKEVVVTVHHNDGHMGKMFNVYDKKENHLFCIDTEGDIIF